MAAESSETVSLPKQYQQALDPISLLLSQNLNFIMERGPRYRAYAELREYKLRSRKQSGNEENQDPKLTPPPPKKQVKFQVVMSNSTSSSSILAQSVPDFSSALRRKDNRKPVIELTPPPPHSKAWSRSNLAGSNAKGSKSANAGEKKKNNKSELMAARKSCVNLEELRGFSGGDDRGGHLRGSRLTGRNVFGFTRF